MSEEKKDYIPQRDDKGHFLPGVSGNPKGKPEGSLSLVTLIKRKLQEEVPDGEFKKFDSKEKMTYAGAVVLTMVKKAIEDEDVNILRMFVEHIDGKPKQSIEVDDKGEKVNQLADVINLIINQSKHAEAETATIESGAEIIDPPSV